MPFPIVFGLLVAAGAIGVGTGIKGAVDVSTANEIGQNADRRLRSAQRYLEQQQQDTQWYMEQYGELLLKVHRNTIHDFVAFLESIENHVESDRYLRLLAQIGIHVPTLQQFKLDVVRAYELAGGALGAMGTGAAASAGTLGLVGLFGTASTGTAISALSGAAAKSATLAWLGGGSLASGGAGMAGGAAVLGGLAVAPALLIGGFYLASKGEEALTQAYRHKARIDIAITKIENQGTFLRCVQERIRELQSVVQRLDQQAQICLKSLHTATFSAQNTWHVQKLQRVGMLVSALAEISRTPIINTQGTLSWDSQQIYLKYRDVVI